MNQQIQTQPKDDQTVEIDLLDLLGLYMSRLPLLIAAIIIGALIAGLVTTFMIPKKYTSTSKMYMLSSSSNSVLNLSDLNLGTSLSKDYVQLMYSRPALEDVITKLQLDLSYSQLRSMISMSVVEGTRIISINVTSKDPQLAMDIANQMTHTTKILLPKVMDAPAPTIVEEAILPSSPSSPNLRKNVMVGGMALLVLVLAILTILYLMDDTIKNAEDLEREFGVMPLSVVPEGEIKGLKDPDQSGKKSRRRKRKYTSYTTGNQKKKKGGKA